MKPDPDFLKDGYHRVGANGREVIREELMDTHARAYGELFAGRERRHQVSSTQLRAFHGDVKALERKIDRGGSGAFERNYHLIKMLKSKVSYAQGKRSGGQVSEAFRDYIHTCVDAIQDEEGFRAFAKFFESTVGFYYGAGGGRIR